MVQELVIKCKCREKVTRLSSQIQYTGVWYSFPGICLLCFNTVDSFVREVVEPNWPRLLRGL